MRVLRKMRNIASNVNDKKLLILGVQTKCPMRTKGGYKRVAFLCICKFASHPQGAFLSLSWQSAANYIFPESFVTFYHLENCNDFA